MKCFTLYFFKDFFHRLFGIVGFKNNCDADNDNSLYLRSQYSSHLSHWLLTKPASYSCKWNEAIAGPTVFGCHGLSSFHKLLLGNLTRQLALFLSTLTTHCLKYNELEIGQRRMAVPKHFLSSPTVLLPCHMMCWEQNNEVIMNMGFRVMQTWVQILAQEMAWCVL